MVIVGQAGSGTKGQRQEEILLPWEEKGKGRRMERGGHAEDLYKGQAGESGTTVRAPGSGPYEVCGIKETESPSLSFFTGGPQDPLPKRWNANLNAKTDC